MKYIEMGPEYKNLLRRLSEMSSSTMVEDPSDYNFWLKKAYLQEKEGFDIQDDEQVVSQNYFDPPFDILKPLRFEERHLISSPSQAAKFVALLPLLDPSLHS